MTSLDSILKSRDIILLTKVHIVRAMVFLVVMWELGYKEGWVPKNWCFQIMMLETFESPLNSKKINKSILKEINSEYSLEGLMMKLKLPILWPPDVKSWLNGKKPPDARKDWGQKEKGATENGMVRQYHRLNGHEFEEPLGDSEGQRNLVCYSPCGWKELDMT